MSSSHSQAHAQKQQAAELGVGTMSDVAAQANDDALSTATKHPFKTIRELIDCRAKRQEDRVFLMDTETGSSLSYVQLQKEAMAVAHFIAKQGVAIGESVAYAMSNSRDCATCLLGIMYGGYRATAINLVAGNVTIAYVLAHSETKLILTQVQHSSLLQEALALHGQSIPLTYINDDFWRTAFSFSQDAAKPAQAMNEHALLELGFTDSKEALLMYTSGTTGTPKGVLLTHKNLLAGGDNTVLAHSLTEQDRALCVLPLYHINGLCVTLIAPLLSAGSVVMPKRFSASLFWLWVQRYSCTWFSVVPTQISYLLHAEPQPSDPQPDNTSLRMGRSASAPLAPEVQRAFEQRFGVPIIETMGLTETSAQILSNPLPPATRKIGSPGIAVGNNVMVVDANQKVLAAGIEGEIIVRGDNVMKGYFKNPEVSAQAMNQAGWLLTGDLGHKDNDGYVFVTGRLKELIIKGGENIAPREIDDALYSYTGVIEAAAFARPCEHYGQTVEAAVCVDPELMLVESVLLSHCEAILGRFKTPDKIHFLNELPKGPSGKIQRNKLLEILGETTTL